MHRFMLSLSVLLLAANLPAQKELAWPVLTMTTYQVDEETGKMKPTFPKVLETNFENQEVTITGYLIPMDVSENKYALSKNPFTSCFFCGNAGPATVIELQFKEDPGRFATDKYLMVKGRLRLNRSGSDLFFTLLETEVYG